MNSSGSIYNPILGTPKGGVGTNAGVAFFQKFVPAAITLGLIIGALFFFYGFITGAITWIASGGDKQKVEEARSRITNAIVGLLILFALFAIIRVLGYFFRIDLLELTIPTVGS
jgi:hypothetical protein